MRRETTQTALQKLGNACVRHRGKYSFTALPYSATWEQVQSGRVCAAPLSSLEVEWVIACPMERHISLAAQRFAEA